MATVDLTDLIPDLEGYVSVPGSVSRYSTASETEWLTKLRNAFWTAYNDGLIIGFSCNEEGVISSVRGDLAMGRDLQQIVILYSAISIVQNELLQIKTAFRAKAGPVEYETQQSAQVLKGLLDSLFQQKNVLLKRLSDIGEVQSHYFDAVITRDASYRSGLTSWVR